MSRQLAPIADLGTVFSCLSYGSGHSDREGVCLKVRIGRYHVLLDCGLSDIDCLFEPTAAPIDAVFCTHAHSDHARGLFALHERLPDLPVFASEVTARLLPLNWPERESVEGFCRPIPWRSPVEIFDGLSVELFPAGHLPGAAAILLTYVTPQRTYKLLYTGDFSLSNLQLVDGLSVESLRAVSPDVLILEGTYGIDRHPHRRQQEKQLMQRIDLALRSGQSVLLPVPLLGLGQEILKLLRSHHQFTGRDVDIWVTEAIAHTCDGYLDLLPQLPLSVQNFAKHQPLFWDERICPRLRRLPADLDPASFHHPCILMVEAFQDFSIYCRDSAQPWLVLLPASPEKYWGKDSQQVEFLAANAYVSLETYLLAEHSDGRNTAQLIHNLRPQHVIFVHGTPDRLADLTSLEELQSRYQLHLPAFGTQVDLPLGEKFIQPAAPAAYTYEGELNELDNTVTIALPKAIAADPRWLQFADSGLVEVRWQGDDLLVRGISQRELVSQQRKTDYLGDIDCCRNCRHYHHQRCWNPLSPLNGFKVTPEGYCPVFESKEME